ncbi:MAG: DUF5810 domain-containing protein [Haloferacaceae archaeon]
MGYACPVCEIPQRDAEHLANHLAFAAMLHGDDHRTWLDEHAPGWADEGPAELGERVAPLAPEATYEEVFEESVPENGPGRPFADRGGPPSETGRSAGDGALDDTARAALAEAREMTRRMRGEGGGADADDGDGVRDDDGSDGERG